VALTQDDLTQLLEAIRAGGDVEVIRRSVEVMLQALIEAEANEVIGAERHGRRRIVRALFAVVIEAYVHGVSTRRVDDLVAALGLQAGISKSEVSRICAELDTALEAFRTGPLRHVEFPYVFLDAIYIKAGEAGRVLDKAVVVATGVTATGDRKVLGCAAGDSEDGAFWTAFLRSLAECHDEWAVTDWRYLSEASMSKLDEPHADDTQDALPAARAS
jgi:putative transposase